MQRIAGVWYPDWKHKELSEIARDQPERVTDLYHGLRYVTDWSLAIDGGAFVGLWTRVLSRYFGQVWAFEPDDENYACLQANTADLDNLILVKKALGEKSGDGYLSKESPPSRHLGKQGSRVDIVPLDAYQLKPGFIKLDIEGCESLALQGAGETLTARPVVMLEDKHWTRFSKRHPSHYLPDYRERGRVNRDVIYTPMTAAAD